MASAKKASPGAGGCGASGLAAILLSLWKKRFAPRATAPTDALLLLFG